MAWSAALLLLLAVPQVSSLMEGGTNVVTTVASREHRYSSSCGVWGWGRCGRSRTVYYKVHNCQTGYRSTDNRNCPYAICAGRINLYEACNQLHSSSHIIYTDKRKQYRGEGTCSTPETCTGCNEGFWSSQGRCKMCCAIPNCDLEVCRSAWDQTCSRCEGVVSEFKGERAYMISNDKRSCLKACSWRSDSTSCYPGTCDQEIAMSCKCHEGFSAPNTHCRTIDTSPSILYNELTMSGSGWVPKTAPPDPNSGQPQEMSWTNIHPTSIKYDFIAGYKITGQLPSRHAYIVGFEVGIVRAQVQFTLIRDNQAVSDVEIGCSEVGTSRPKGFLQCTDSRDPMSLLGSDIQNEDVLRYKFVATNGGYVKIRNSESGTVSTFLYQGKTAIHSFSIGFDYVNPHHCSVEVNSICSDSMLTVARTSLTSPIHLEWKGWLDNVAVGMYEVDIYELALKDANNPNEKLETKSRAKTVEVPGTQNSVDADLSEAGAGIYEAVLAVFDKAGNHKTARRVFIYDGESQIETVPNTVLRPTSAAPQSQYLWQWTTQSVTFDWNNRYLNHLHDRNKWLNGVASYPGVETDYDDTGFALGLDPIDNVQGVVEYETSYLVDHSGGRSIQDTPPDHKFTSQGLAQGQTITPALMDGDTLRLWLRAFDVRREFLEEKVTIHIDTSPPVIEDMWLTKGDRLNVSVHSVLELEQMTFEWVAYDDHSGLETVSWRLFDNFTGEELLHRHERIGAQGLTSNLSDCKTTYGGYPRGANCYCTPAVGCYHRHFQVKPITANSATGGVFSDNQTPVHDPDYYLGVEVMNHAKLTTKLEFKVSIF